MQKVFPDVILNEPLSRYSTFQIGGPADYFYRLKDSKKLKPLLQFCKKNRIPYFILGGGSNTLFDDKGFRGMVIKNETKNIKFSKTQVTVDSGLSVATLLNETIKNGYQGLEKWVGLPGTIGGAVRGNAGCNGLETKDVLIKATILDLKTLKTKKVTNKYFAFKYRFSKLKKSPQLVLNATFKVSPRKITLDEQKSIITELNKNRIAKQPFGLSCGSFFKNPVPHVKEKAAGYLIEQAGLKGKTLGKAQISPKHGNFFLNLGGATSADIKNLAKLVQKAVQAKFKIKLEPEVYFLLEKPIKI